ncbi:MAG: dihydrolipoamide acetyltransferase family protein [Acidobacteriota bacterium]
MGDFVEITAPTAEQEGSESVLSRWLKKEGDPVHLHEPLLEINTDKVVIEIPAPADGILCRIVKRENETLGPGEVLGRIAPAGDLVAAPGEPPCRVPEKGGVEEKAESPGLSPAVRRLLKEHGLDASSIQGSGRGGRITRQDVLACLPQRETVPKAAGAATIASNRETATRPGRRVPHTPMRKSIAGHMVSSLLRTAPHVTAVFEADCSALLSHRARHKEAFRSKGVKLTYTSYLVAASVRALGAIPEVNSRWHPEALEIFQDCNIGVATALGRSGLIVPVIHRAQNLSLFDLATRLQDLTRRARGGKLRSDEIENGTFTITNHGMTGSLIATPIIHQPQSAILGFGRIAKRLIVAEESGRETMQIRPMAYVTLTIDHRALDGYTANLFLSEFVTALAAF